MQPIIRPASYSVKVSVNPHSGCTHAIVYRNGRHLTQVRERDAVRAVREARRAVRIARQAGSLELRGWR